MSDDILNMSLDDIIASKQSRAGAKADKPSGKGSARKTGESRGRGSKRFEESLKVTLSNKAARSGKGPALGKAGARVRIMEVSGTQALADSAPRNRAALDGNAAWEHDLYDEGPAVQAQRVRPAQSGYKLYITNLDYKVSDEDVQELFENCGPVKKAGVNYDRSGRSLETAEVIFERREDAVAALKRYNNLELDNKPMKINLVEGPTSAAGGRTLSSGIRIGSMQQSGVKSTNGARAFAVASRPRMSGGRISRSIVSIGRRPARGRGPTVSQEDLDKDLQDYMATD